jgi:hypothetical protein
MHTLYIYNYNIYTLVFEWLFKCMYAHTHIIHIYMVKITSTRPPERATKDVAEPDSSSNVFPGLQFSGAV